MADEIDTTPAADPIHSEGLDFAQMITGDEPEIETPAAETPLPAKEEKPAEEKPAEEKPKEEKPAVEEDENPFDVEDKPKEDKPAGDEKEPEKPTSSDDWSRLRESRNRYKAEAAERDALLREKEVEVAELKQKAARTVELEEKLRVFDEQEKELALARVESTIDYKENILAPLNAIGDEAEALTKENEGDFESIRRMLQEPDRSAQRIKLKELTSGWDDVDRQELKKMADDARTLLDRQEAMRTNAHATSKEQQQIAAQREAEQKEVARKEFAKATDDAVKSIREKVPFVPLVEGETEDDRYSSLAQKVAQVDFEKQTPRAKALAVASTLALPQAIKTIGLRDTEIASLKAALAKALEDTPSVTTKTDTTTDEGEKDFFDAVGVPQPSYGF